MIMRSTGAAPRHRGSSEGCTLSQSPSSSTSSGMSSPYAATTIVSAPSSRFGSGRAGCNTRIPSRSAVSFAGGAPVFCPRPRGASGLVSSVVISWRAARRSSTSAPKGAVAATANFISADDEPGPQSRERFAASLGRRAVQDRRSVEMVELVLHDARGRSFEVVRDLVPVRIAPFDPHRGVPLDGHRHPLNGKAAFIVDLGFVAAPDDLRVDEHGHFVLIPGKDEHAAEHSDLGGGEPDAVRILHQLAQARGEPLEVVVEVLHRRRLHPEDGVRVLADLGERELAPGLALGLELGIELFVPAFSFYLGHLWPTHLSSSPQHHAGTIAA